MKLGAHRLFTSSSTSRPSSSPLSPQGQNTFRSDYKYFTNVNLKKRVLFSGSAGHFQNLKYGFRGTFSVEFELNWFNLCLKVFLNICCNH